MPDPASALNQTHRPGLAALAGLFGTILAVAPLNGLVYLVVHDPQGLLGGRHTMTTPGYVASGLLAAGALLVCLLAMRSPERSMLFGRLLGLAALTPFFFTPAPDLLVLPVAVLLNLWIVHRCSVAGDPDSAGAWQRLAWLNLLLLALILALVGYELATHPWAHLCLALLGYLALLEARYVLPPSSKFLAQHRAAGWALLLLPPLFFITPRLASALIGLLQSVLLLDLVWRIQAVRRLVEALFERPAQMFAASFAAIILIGTLLLSFPMASASGASVRLIDALFTATSATCVTGLIVLDTPHAFSGFGHVVILVLIQLGGLGMVTISSFVSLSLGRRIGLKAEAALGKLYEADRSRLLFDLIRFIVLVTLVIEGTGAVLLALIFWSQGLGLVTSVWYGVFHSVSAFCNAGFALFSDSLVGLNRSVPLLAVVGLLIVLGGIGFGVLSIVIQRLSRPSEVPRLPTHVRLSIRGTIGLLALGLVLLLLLEWNHSLAGLSLLDRLSNAAFQSLTCRTAGFNTVDLALLGPASVFLMILLMFVGACANSTGGGIKVTTAMVLFHAVLSMMRGRNEVEAMGRVIPGGTVYKSVVVATLSLLLITAGIFVLLGTQEGPFHWILFEVFSAFGTVGLSLGMTVLLDDFGRFVIVVLMFVGRVGPLTLALLLEPRRGRPYRLPEASILVG
jgi:trk system potassium uptake protein TrkH